MAENVSLAVLENLVHMANEDFPSGYVIVAAVIPDEVGILKEEELRVRHGDIGRPDLGDRWVESLASVVLQVHSAIVPFEHNYLLNPRHPDFSQIVVEQTAPFLFDERLFRSRDIRG